MVHGSLLNRKCTRIRRGGATDRCRRQELHGACRGVVVLQLVGSAAEEMLTLGVSKRKQRDRQQQQHHSSGVRHLRGPLAWTQWQISEFRAFEFRSNHFLMMQGPLVENMKTNSFHALC